MKSDKWRNLNMILGFGLLLVSMLMMKYVAKLIIWLSQTFL